MTSSGSTPSARGAIGAAALFWAFVAVVPLLLYAPSLAAPFVYDSVNIENASLLQISSLRELTHVILVDGVPRRVGWATLALNFYVDGLRPFGYHLVNVLLHAANGVLLFWLSVRLLSAQPDRSRLIAMAAAMLFLVHTVQTGAVAYVYQRFTLLCALFFVLSLCCFLEARMHQGGRRAGWYAASAVSGILALGSKENAGMLPLMLALITVVFPGESERVRDRRNGIWIGACFIAFLTIAAFYLGPNFVEMIENDYARRGFTLSERLLTEFRVVVYYLSLLVYPHPSRLTLDYDFPLSTSLLSPPVTLVCAVILIVLLVSAVMRAGKNPLYAFATLWFLGNLAIESTFVPLDIAYEHRVYLPSMMVFLWFAHAVLETRWRRFTVPGLIGLGLVLSVWTYQRNLVWADPVALWEDNARKSPGKARVHANLGRAYVGDGAYEKARGAFERAIELDPAMTGAIVSLANLHLDHTKDFAAAERLLDEVVRAEPGNTGAHVGLGLLHLRRSDFPRAIVRFERALEQDASNRAALYNLSAAHFNLGEFEQAIVHLERAVHYWPADAQAFALLGAAYIESGSRAEAKRALETSLRLDADNALALRYQKRLLLAR